MSSNGEQARGPDELARLDELRDVRELVTARERFAAGILELSAELSAAEREQILADDTKGPHSGRRWSFEKVEACWRRLRELEASAADAALADRVQELSVHKRTMERLRDRLVLENVRLVPHVVLQLGHNRQVPFMNLVQEGNLGLMRAVDQFDPELGNRFSTYAYWWIRQAVGKALDKKSRMIRLPGHVLNSRRALNQVRQQFLDEHDREPTPTEIAERMGVTPRKVCDLLSLVADPQPLETHGADDDGVNMQDRPAAEDATPLETLLDVELRTRLQAAMNLLTAREEVIVRLRFGIGRAASHTLKEIGEKLSLTRERVRQIERTALAKISAAEHEVFGRGAAMTA